MLARILQISAALILVSCEKAQEVPEVFNGHFISDRDATIKRWRKTQPWGDKTQEIIEKLGPILGVTEIVTEGTNYILISEDWQEEGESEFLSIDGTTAKIRNFSDVLDMEIISKIQADSNGYWLYSDSPMEGYVERFTRKGFKGQVLRDRQIEIPPPEGVGSKK